jgi:hypothetical protein
MYHRTKPSPARLAALSLAGHRSSPIETNKELEAMAIVASVVVSLAIGWLLGMWTRKRSDTWCPVDGTKLSCPRCTTAGAHFLGSPANLTRRSSTVEGAA